MSKFYFCKLVFCYLLISLCMLRQIKSEDIHVDLLNKLLPDLVNLTRFSPRQGTPAATYKRVNSNTVKARSKELTELRKKLGAKSFKRFVGKKTSVLAVENQRQGSTLCRDDNYRPIIIKEELPLGEFYDVEIIDSDYAFLTAVL